MSKLTYTEREIQDIADRVAEKMEADGPMSGPESRMILRTPWGLVFEHGQIFEAKTVKGGVNYVLFLFQQHGLAYYAHGDKSKKVPKEKFIQLIESGELNPIERSKADPERIALAVLGLQAMAQGLSFNDYMKVIWNEGEGSRAD